MHASLRARPRACLTHGAHHHIHHGLTPRTSSNGDHTRHDIGVGEGAAGMTIPGRLSTRWSQLRCNVTLPHKFGVSTFFAIFFDEIQSRREIESRD